MTPDTRVWLLPNGNLATSSSDPLAEFWIHLRDGEGIEAADVLPAGAAPLTALPEPVPVDRDGHGYLVRHREPFAYFPSVLVHKDTTVAEVRKHINWLAAELSDQIAALELLELEGGSTESAVEAARRKVLTSGEIRSLYVETLARTTYEGEREAWADIEPRAPWAELSFEEREPWLGQEEQYATALAEAGLLPTQVEEHGPIPVYSDDETIAYWQPRSRRFVTERREVTG